MIDLLCYAALAVNLLAMSQSSQLMLRILSAFANLLLGTYAFAIGAHALIFATSAVIGIHIYHISRRNHGRDPAP